MALPQAAEIYSLSLEDILQTSHSIQLFAAENCPFSSVVGLVGPD